MSGERLTEGGEGAGPGTGPAERPRAASRFDTPEVATASLVTVLFADVVSSTTQIAAMELEEAQDLLDSAVARMRQRIRQYGGTIARIQGDGVIAIFGAPTAYEDHALRACCAAQAMCEDFRSLPAGAGATDAFRTIRVGLHTGRALIRSLKNDRSDFDALGPDVHVAAKVEELAPRNGAMLTAETLALAGAAVLTVERGDFAVAPNRTLKLYELAGVAFERNLASQLDDDGSAPFVGRDAALQKILKLIEPAAAAAAGASIAIVGEAGIGKTRLAHEVARTVRALGLKVNEIAGISVLRHTPFAALKPFVRDLLACGPSASADELRTIARVQGVPADLQPGLLEAAGAAHDDPAWSALGPEARRERMFAAIADLVERNARRQPLLVLIEDVHHLDPETTDFLTALHALTSRARLWLLMTARGIARDVAARAATETVELSAMTAGEAKELCRFLWPANRTLDLGHVERVVGRAAGNPFFLQELLRMPEAAGGGDDTPLGIASLVQSRMAALTTPARRVIQGASVLGDEIERPILAATCGVAEADLGEILGELEHQNLLDASNPKKIRFRHDLFRGGARLTLLRAEAAEIHGRAARAFEEQGGTSVETLERLAYHAERSGQIEKALAQLLTACQLGVRTSAQKTIRALYDWAMRLKPSVPEAGKGALLDLVMTSLDALQQSGDTVEYERALQLAIELCEARGERFREGIARSHYAVFNWIWSRHDAARIHAGIALKIAHETRVFALRDIAQSMKAHIEQATGELDAAIATYTDLLAAYSPEDERSTMGRMFLPSVRCCAFLAVFLVDRGRFAEAQSYVERGERILGATDQPYSRTMIANAHGRVALAMGRADEAVKHLELAHQTSLKNQIHLLEPAVAGWLAIALTRAGRPEEGRAVARYSVFNKLYERAGRYAAVQVFRGLAEAEFACGDTASALATANEALKIAAENKEPIHVAQTRYLRGLILCDEAIGKPAEGRDDLEAALAASLDLHLDPLAADCRAALARRRM